MPYFQQYGYGEIWIILNSQKASASWSKEIRKYSDRLAVEVISENGNSGFRKLFNYISGQNENNQEIGNITSGCYSPILKKSIAIGYINKSLDMSEKLFVKIRDKLEEIQIEKIPFVKKNYKKGD